MPAVVLLAALAACNAPQPTPAGAIPYGEDTFMVPVADADPACPGYTMTSPTRMTVQAIFYRKADGTFTMIRAEACPGR